MFLITIENNKLIKKQANFYKSESLFFLIALIPTGT